MRRIVPNYSPEYDTIRLPLHEEPEAIQQHNYCCQMTGERIGERYDAIVVEAHHIVPFTQSMNNDSSNLIIISPSYHRIIHAAKPEWNPINLSFKYPNGVVDRVVLNKHLKTQVV